MTRIRPVSASAVAFVRTIVTFVPAITLVSPVHANSSVLGKGGYDRKIDYLALELSVLDTIRIRKGGYYQKIDHLALELPVLALHVPAVDLVPSVPAVVVAVTSSPGVKTLPVRASVKQTWSC